MALDYTGKKRRRGPDPMDVIHVILAVLTVALFVFCMTKTDKRIKLFPFVFLFAAIMNLFDGVYKIQHLPHGKKNISGVVLSFFLTLLILGTGVYISIPIYF